MSDKLLDHLKRALGEAYTIERELPGAGMSRVFVAREHALGREVVIKVLPKELAAGVNRERFQQEVQLAARLSHPYIVPLLHAGEHEDLLWFTMPFITGESLKYRLEHAGPVPITEMIQFTRDTLEALAYAHSKGVIHRDIKPANILVDGGHAVVTDFGVAKALSAAMPTMGTGHTTTGMAIGTPAYMAPEQLAADPAADHRVDIYAMGLLMYELLAGASPFSASSPTATMTAQLTRMPDPLDRLRKDVPSALSALIMSCLAKSPDERPATADAVLKGLDQISGQLAAEAHGSSQQSMLLRRMIPITAVLAVIIVAAAGAMIWMGRNNNPPPVAPAVITPLPAGGAGDAGQALPLQGNQNVVRLETREDTVRMCLKFNDSIACGLKQRKASAAQTPAVTVVQAPLNIDSMVKAAVAAQLNAMGINMPRPPAAPDMPRGVGGGLPATNVNRLAPRKAVLAVLGGGRRGGRDSMDDLADSVNKAATEKVIADFTQMLGRNWQLVRSDPNRPPMPNDTLFRGADAIVSVNLGPDRTSRDSVELMMTVINPAGGFRYARIVVPTSRSPADFRNLVQQAAGWMYELSRNPGVPWDGPDMLRGGPQQGGPPRMGGGQGRGGGGQRFPGDSGRGGGGNVEGWKDGRMEG